MSGIAEVEETGRFILVLKDFSLEPPHLSIEVRSLDRDGDPETLRGGYHVILYSTVSEALLSIIGSRLRSCERWCSA